MKDAPRRDPRIVIFTDDPGWHGRRLLAGLAARGHAGLFVSLADCGFACDKGAPRIRIPGFEHGLPRGAFVRGVPGGSLEQVVLRLDVLHCLALAGVPVFNSGRAIERTVDKAMTSFLLAHHGIPTPPTWVCETLAEAQARAAPLFAAGEEVVLKPLFGSQGEGLQRLDSAAALAAAMPAGGVYYLQHYLARGGPPYRDWRIMVIDGCARFQMERVSEHWVTNRAQGARCVASALDTTVCALAEAAAAAIDIDYAGVDLLQEADGRWVVGEVNGVPAWWGLAQATGADVTGALLDAFCARLT